jgi:excisionase family DNA binding protein
VFVGGMEGIHDEYALFGEGGRGALLTAKQVARRLWVSTAWVYEQSRLGRIPTVTLGRRRRYRAEAIAEWLEGLEAPAGAASLTRRDGVGRGAVTRRRASSARE